MFTNRPACTIWEKTLQDRAWHYVRHQTGAAYCEMTVSEKTDGSDRKPQKHLLCILSAENIGAYLPKPDDRIVSGICEEAKPPATALTVSEVRDFRYGSAKVQHIEVEAE